jgi:nucleoside-diphosphate-sugar epimerase
VSTVGVFGNTRGELVDEKYRRDLSDGWLSCYDETKFRAHEAAQRRIADGAPIVIVQPSQVYGPNDHSLTSEQLARAHAGRLRFVALPSSGACWVHVDDLADGILAALDRGVTGESYILSGECLRFGEAVATAARVAGRRPPRMTLPATMLKAIAYINDPLGGLPGSPANLRETVTAGDNVTYWATSGKATRELGFAPRSLEQGIGDTWGKRSAPAKQSRRTD